MIKKKNPYFESVGRRKTSVARVRLYDQEKKGIVINEKKVKEYFPTPDMQQRALFPLETMNCLSRFYLSIRVKGGGISSQADAVSHGIARALVEFNPDFKKKLRKAGSLTRDPRMRERKKFGLKRARRAPQWRKR